MVNKYKKMLEDNGCKIWSEKEGLMLVNKKFYNKIPEGFDIVDIFGEKEKFIKGTTDDDYRYDCLSFGVLEEDYKKLCEVLEITN